MEFYSKGENGTHLFYTGNPGVDMQRSGHICFLHPPGKNRVRKNRVV